MRLLFVTFITLLSACTPQSGALSSRDTNLIGQYTRQIPISDHPHHVLMGHLVDVHHDGTDTLALVIGQRRDGVHRLRVSGAWSNGVELPFSATGRRLDGCTHGHCRDNPVGMIFISEQLFTRAHVTGLTGRLIGRSEIIDIHVPPSLFLALQE